jgi:hypothetical protein
MLLVFMLAGAVGLSIVALGYSALVGSRHRVSPQVGKMKYPDLWLASLLDCEYSPTKQAYGPARILPATRLNLQHTPKECEAC